MDRNLATYCKQQILIIKLGKLFSQLRQVSFLVVKTAKGTYKYHMTLREGVYSNGQEYRHMGRGLGQIVI